MIGEQHKIPFIAYPTRMESAHFTTNDDDLSDLPWWGVQELQRQLTWKLNMEMARLYRLLPDAPRGYDWELEFEYSEDIMHNTITYRVVARLKAVI